MKKLITRLLSYLLFLGILTPLIASCNNNSNSDNESYYSSMMVTYNGEGSYKGNFSLSDEVDDKFISISKDDFSLSVYDGSSSNASATLNDFTITKTTDKSFDLSFSSPFGYKESLNYILESEKGVTKNGHKITAIVYVSAPEVDLDVTYTGAFRGSDKIILTISLNEGWKFVSELNNGMLIFPEGMDLSVNVLRESDTKAVFTINNVPIDFSGTSIDFTLQKSAIDSVFAKDIYLNIDFTQVELSVDQSSISYDETNNILTVGKVNLPNNVKGKDGGISLSNVICEIKEQSYNSTDNYYTFKIGFNELYSDIYKDLDKENYIYNLSIDASLIIDDSEITYSFSPIDTISNIKSSVKTDEDNKLVTVELLPVNASFKEDASSSLIKITGSENLTNFKCLSITKDKIIYTADYTSELTNGVVLSFVVDGSILNTNLHADSYSFSTYIPPFLTDKDFDWSDIEEELVKSAAKGLGSAIFSSISAFVLPYIYDFLDVDTSDLELSAIRDSVTKLSYAINDLSNDINNLSSDIITSTNKTILDNFQTLETTLLSSSLSLLKDENVINYTSYLKNTIGDSYQKILDNESGLITYEKFVEYYYSAHGGKDHACFTSSEGLEAIYNASVHYASNSEYSFSKFCEGYPEYSTFRSSSKSDACRVLDPDRVYSMVKDAKGYDSKLDVKIPDLERNEGFESAFEKLNFNNAYISNVVNLGSRILSNASGTSEGIIDLFFSVVDTMYNFESQTTNIKKSFVSKLQSIYLVSAAIAIQYCDATNDTGNAALIRKDVRAACLKFDDAFNKIKGCETNATKGNDRILVSNQLVSKDLKCTKVSDMVKTTKSKGFFDDTYKKTIDAYYVSIDTLRTMVTRAQKRGMSLATDLNKAGFKNITAAFKDTYVYLSTGMKWNNSDNSYSFWGYGGSYKNYVMKGDFITQKGTENPVSYRNYQLLACYLNAIMYQEAEYEVRLNGGFNYVVGFAAPKQ